jgi:hypothetical protein
MVLLCTAKRQTAFLIDKGRGRVEEKRRLKLSLRTQFLDNSLKFITLVRIKLVDARLQ